MLILTGDDFGRDRETSDRCLECFRQNRITSASLMVFMKDSESAAAIAAREGLEIGLHLNLVHQFDSREVTDGLKRIHRSVTRFFGRGPWTQVIFDPLIIAALASDFHAQVDEYRRLLGKEPAFYNGHRHLHLSLNMVFGGLLPVGSAVRRSFTFRRGEKSAINRAYRRLIDRWILRQFITTDSFFSLSPVDDAGRLERIIGLASTSNVELMAHPSDRVQLALLTGSMFKKLLANIPLGNFGALKDRARSLSGSALGRSVVS